MGLLNEIAGTRLYLDANVFIYALEGYPDFVDELISLTDELLRGTYHAVTSELTLADCLVKPIADRQDVWIETYQKAVQTSATLSVVPVSRSILIEAANIRASTGLRLPDAIHASTSRILSCTSFLTNDGKFRSVQGLNVLVLSDVIFLP